jgi:hypothetical protein
MEKQSESVRDRLLARLPQPENLAAYQEEVRCALAKHEKALLWEKMPSTVCYVSSFAIVMADNFWGQKLAAATTHFIWLWAGLLFFVGAINELRYHINRSKVDMLKEVKQAQLQVLELQASLRKGGDLSH